MWFYQPLLRSSSATTSYTLACAPGAFAISGTAATLKLNRRVAASAGTLAITGTAATLKFNRMAAASSGAFALTGTAATLKLNRLVAAASGALALTGTTASLRLNRVVVAVPSAVDITGTDAALIWNGSAPATEFVISCDSGAFLVRAPKGDRRFKWMGHGNPAPRAAHEGGYEFTLGELHRRFG